MICGLAWHRTQGLDQVTLCLVVLILLFSRWRAWRRRPPCRPPRPSTRACSAGT